MRHKGGSGSGGGGLGVGDMHALFRENDSSCTTVNQGQERCSKRGPQFPRVAHLVKPHNIIKVDKKEATDTLLNGEHLDLVSF